MKVFISWSGQRSKVVAELFSDWLKCVIQASQPWISTRSIDRGAIWFTEINDSLKDVSVGVILLTQENKNKPWILFETGALAKGLTTNRVCTFLIDLKPEDLKDPLAQFNHTTPGIDSMWELVRTINGCLNERALDERILKQVFNTYWPQFDEEFQTALENNPQEEDIPPRSPDDILNEILNTTRSLEKRVRNIENNRFGSTLRKDLAYNNSYSTDDVYRAQADIYNIMNIGVREEDAIMKSLGKYNLPESILRSLIKGTALAFKNEEKTSNSE
ncbi:MAG: toll-Interleukin receptor [Enterobacteriaceae bacterium]|nr:toll-Interleukin receptor [Enterobacteriaceae bacterium]